MIRRLTYFLSVVSLVSLVTLVSSDIFQSAIERKINETLISKNVSDDALLIDLKTFVSYDGVRSGGAPPVSRNASDVQTPTNSSKGSLRVYPEYHHPYPYQMRNKMMDLMRQDVYSTQERMEALVPILKKYENDYAFRMAFIFNRLKQLVIDIRRIYTLAWQTRYHSKSGKTMRVYEQIFWYAHAMRKYFDILYIVEYLLHFHKQALTFTGFGFDQ